MTKLFLALALVALATLAPWTPAEAAVKKRPALATHVLPCNDGTDKVARAWYPWQQGERQYRSWAADNPCRDQWLIFNLPGDSVSDPYGRVLNVGPGRSFHRSSEWFTADSDSAVDVYLAPVPRCSEFRHSTFEVRRDGRFKRVRDEDC